MCEGEKMDNLCYCNSEGKVITSKDPEYEIARQEWNRSLQKYPVAIAYCKTNEDIKLAICLASKLHVKLRIRSGGHNYEGYSNGDNVLVIDISEMNDIKIDEKNNIITIQGGVNNRKLYNFVTLRGYPFPGGTCPTVGAAGYTLGGGWGLSSRIYGLLCDSLIEFEMINYNGEIITANKKMNSDLFWACRGSGGGNFGVITSLKYKLPKKVEKLSYVTLFYENPTKCDEILFFKIWQQWIKKADCRINLQVSLYNSLKNGIQIYGRGFFYGFPEDAKEILKPFYAIPNAKINIEYLPIMKAVLDIFNGYAKSEKFKSTGRFVSRQLTDSEIENMVEFINQSRPKGSITTALNVYGLGGKVKDVEKDETAYYFRDANYILGIQSVWEDNCYKKENVEWVQEKFNYIYILTDGSYVNFPYAELINYGIEYYGTNIYKLEQVKKKYDPCNIFCYPQCIKASL